MARRTTRAVGTVLTFALAGCATQPLWPSTEQHIADAAGIRAGVVVEVEGEGRSEPEDVVTLEQALVAALRYEPRVQVAVQVVREAQAEAWQERLLPNPVVSVALRFPEGGGQPTVEAGLGADLLSLLRRSGRVQAADARLRAASAAAVASVLDLITEVQHRYAEVQALQASVPLLERRRDVLAQMRGLEQARFDVGEIGRLDLVTLDAERVKLDAEIDELLVELHGARLSLARLMGAPRGQAEWRVAEWVPPPYAGVAEEAWIRSALDHRPEIQQRVYELEALGVEEQQIRLWLSEGVELGLDAEHADSAWEAGPALSVPIPIFDWGQASRAQARSRRLQAMHELEATKWDVIEQARQAAAAFNASVHRLRRVRDELLPLQEERRRLAEQGFRAGEGSALAVLAAEQDLFEARQRLVELEHRTSDALAELHRAVGGAGHAAAPVDGVEIEDHVEADRGDHDHAAPAATAPTQGDQP